MTKQKEGGKTRITKHSVKKYEYKGASYSLRELANTAGISPEAMRRRIEVRGWPIERAVTEPLETRFHHRSDLAGPDIEIPPERISGLRMSFEL